METASEVAHKKIRIHLMIQQFMRTKMAPQPFTTLEYLLEPEIRFNTIFIK